MAPTRAGKPSGRSLEAARERGPREMAAPPPPGEDRTRLTGLLAPLSRPLVEGGLGGVGFPRLGLIRVDAADQVLFDLRSSFGDPGS